MKFKFLKNVALCGLLIGLASFSSSYAASIPVAQQAYYDTFTFKVNNIVQYISDITKKPFIANSRVYVPISTLSDLGIANVQWIPQNAGMPAELRVMPAQAAEDKSAYYEQKLNELATQIAQKDVKIKELEENVKKLTDENSDLKKKSDSRSTPSSDDRDIKNKVYDLQSDISRDRDYDRITINRKDFTVSYSFRYKRDFEAEVYIKGLSNDDVTALKDNDRQLTRLLEDVGREITKKEPFKNVNVYFTIYDESNNSKQLGSFDYKDDRLRGNLSR
ncbi:hypothetical protein HMPREF9630_01940 [Peptoanaerobacter stomatis]|jgi:hypothetical protein|uniref:Copper amine oxidase-like N-terminal domain-containing protein n=1 Tax=Peptoanaerobacter stomatis TaxID=796937 RepID=J5W618_9FIRM|nr:hypothetical protein [Peptoanaerobacter stomatis]EHL16222.1 hypothetical protein HMPREF9630_01940 [Peptoanaerobacter stomatis]EJU19552.1 hypothetical protein HMPREF1143_0176 [Peptoanaerobacter stomatis]NWO25350.1 hypothetical protein [Peptostreptococcaceae bacterium oral taxon 081]